MIVHGLTNAKSLFFFQMITTSMKYISRPEVQIFRKICDFGFFHRILCFSRCLCLGVTTVHTGRISAKITNEKMTFVDFDICLRMASLRNLYSVTLTYFFKLKNLKC